MDFTRYLRSLQKDLSSGKATEHTYRPALKTLVESVQRAVRATNEPKREQCGAPDFIVQRRDIPLGYIECKDIGTSLDEQEKSEQMERYRAALANLILTDYLEFRYYVQGQRKLTARLGAVDPKGKIRPDASGQAHVLQLLETFLAAEWPAINKPRELAARMAKLAQLIRRTILGALEHESKRGKLHQQMKGFRDVLLHDLTQDQFADMYAQTICYGLFAARYNIPSKEVDKFNREHAAYDLPKSNPFLRSMFSHIAGPELPSSITWVVDDVAELLRRADILAILKGFGKRARRHDPVFHFYETFLGEYDPKMRQSRGVYYTPEPVVSFIVGSIHRILKKDFKLKDGLGDASLIKKEFPMPGTDERETRDVHRVQILDPAAGTGTFLYGVILQIHQTFRRNRGLWPGYISKHLLPRLFGFELLMAPYAIAHMKLDLLLKDTGYDFATDERVNIFLTNTLEEAEYKAASLFAGLIAEEANQASGVKRDVPVMVIMANPPYSGLSANMNPWIDGLLKKPLPLKAGAQGYYEVDGHPLGERKVWLQDDYVKFIRFAQHRIELTGYGVLGFITNHGYLDNPTFRGMRQSLMQTFDEIYILDLHGSTKKKEKAPDGTKDENVFDIQQGVAIGLFVKRKKARAKKPGEVFHSELWGTRKGKYDWLSANDVQSVKWTHLSPNSPYYFFVPRDERLRAEFEAWPQVTDIFAQNVSGIITARDDFAVHFEDGLLLARIAALRNTKCSDSDIRREFFAGKGSKEYPPGDSRGWKLPTARKIVQQDCDWDKRAGDIFYRPFDVRRVYYAPWIVDWPRSNVMPTMLGGENLGIHTCRQIVSETWGHVLATNGLTDDCYVSNKTRERGYLFPLYLYPGKVKDYGPAGGWPPGKDGRRPNLSPKFVAQLAANLGLKFIPDGAGDLKTTVGPEDIFHYAYAVFHSPTYRNRYAEFLKIEFARLPLASDKKLFARVCELGAELVGLHVLERVPTPQATYPQQGSNVVERIGKKAYKPPTSQAPGRVYVNDKQYFEGVAPEVWEFHIGGYQVCEKWLKDRKGRELTFDDINHYRNIVTALSETIRLMAEIDKAIPNWPIE